MDDPRRFAAATTRNRQPILEVLRRVVTPGSAVLEIASGSGEHAIFFAPALAAGSWQPTDPDRDALASIDAWRAHAGPAAAAVKPAIELDVMKAWPELAVPHTIFCANMIHISPWRSCECLLEGAGRLLATGSALFLYGPYKRAGVHIAPSNEQFDASLRARNPEWGVRDLDDVARHAELQALELTSVVEMPANNLCVVFTHR